MASKFLSLATFLLLITLKLVDSRCPQPCLCSADLLEVVCQNQSLSEFPQNIPEVVVSLDLSSNLIETVNPSFLKNLPFLETIDLSSNQIFSIPASCFRQNLRLQSISLDDNLITSIPGEIFSEANNLTNLQLARNRISSIKEADLGNLSKLRVLNLAGNQVSFLPFFFFKSLSNLLELNLSRNHLANTFNLLTERYHGLQRLDLSNNQIASLFVTSTTGFPHLLALDLSGNFISEVDSNWFSSFVNLQRLNLSRNPVLDLSENAFVSCSRLEKLTLNGLVHLKAIGRLAFSGLRELKELEICDDLNLENIHSQAFSELRQLQVLSLRNNSLSFLHAVTLSNLSSLYFLDLSENRWRCDCTNKEFLASLKPMTNERLVVSSGFVCSSPENLVGSEALSIDDDMLTCEVSYKIGSVATLDCPIFEESVQEMTWLTNRLKQYDHHFEIHDDPLTSVTEVLESQDRISILNNGSLIIRSVARADGGNYQCTARNQDGNWSRIVIMKLDYTIVATVSINSLIIGFSAAAAFFGVALVFGAIRKCASACSKEERVKRKSIHEVLNSIRTGSQMDRFSAYRTAKLDQFSAFRSATMDQLSAFTTAKISKLRTYKQMTVTNVLQHLERMRQHYALQTARIKEHCSLQVERLRENYTTQKEKLRGQRSQQMRKIRENYSAQTLKIKEYRVQQMLRLREQYKLQQQHLLKLLELLDVGNCVTVIEAECVRTESTIFDADIAFDIEAQSIHVPQDQTSHSSVELGDISESSSLTGDRLSVDLREEGDFEVPQLEDILPERYKIPPLSEIFMDSVFDSCDQAPDEMESNSERDAEEIAKRTPRDLARASGGNAATNVVRAQIETFVFPPRFVSLGDEGEGEVVESVL